MKGSPAAGAKRRRLIAVLIAVVTLASLLWLLGASLGWSMRDIYHGAGTPAAREMSLLAIAMFALTGIRVLGLISFLTKRRWGWVALSAISIADLVMSLFEAVTRDWAWWLLAGIAALTLFFLFRLRSSGREQPVIGPSAAVSL